MLSFTFSSFLFNLLMAHVGLLYHFFSVFPYSPIVWEESALMPLHSILEDLHTAKSSVCEGEVFMCLVCCDLNDRWLYYLLLSSVCYPSVVLWFITWLLWCFIYRNEGKDTDMHQRLSYDLHQFAFISPQLYEWDCVHFI